jgi:hypothetical protein
MRTVSTSGDGTRPVYFIPEKEFAELLQIRAHVQLMAQIIEPGNAQKRQALKLHPNGLAWWFERMGDDVARILEATYSDQPKPRRVG